MKKYGYIEIVLDDNLGGGFDYQLNHLKNEAKRIGLSVKLKEYYEV